MKASEAASEEQQQSGGFAADAQNGAKRRHFPGVAKVNLYQHFRLALLYLLLDLAQGLLQLLQGRWAHDKVQL